MICWQAARASRITIANVSLTPRHRIWWISLTPQLISQAHILRRSCTTAASFQYRMCAPDTLNKSPSQFWWCKIIIPSINLICFPCWCVRTQTGRLSAAATRAACLILKIPAKPFVVLKLFGSSMTNSTERHCYN